MKVAVLTLGCKVNKYESDALIFELQKNDFEATENLEYADAYIVNTCAVTNEAEKKSRQMIERARKFNPNARIFILGCASQNRPSQFEGKGIDYIGGTSGKLNVISAIKDFQRNQKCAENLEKTQKNHENLSFSDKNCCDTNFNSNLVLDKSNFVLPEKYEDDLFAKQNLTRAFVKVQDGCNRFCTYCIIPYLRGRSRSRSLESVLAEVEKLPESVKEIVVVGIDVSDYRINGEKGLGILLENLDIFGKRIRLSSMEESLIDEEFLKKISNLKNFCPHFHLSLQSGCDRVLKKMNRHYVCDDFEKSVNLIRKYFPLAGITTDIIVGFPTETDEDFNETIKFVEKIKFSQLHIFPYSKRDGTVAEKLYKDLSGEIKSERLKKLEQIGKSLKESFIKENNFGEVLVEEKNGEYCEGYTKNYIKCFFKGDFKEGDIVKVTNFKPYKDGAIVDVVENQ